MRMRDRLTATIDMIGHDIQRVDEDIAVREAQIEDLRKRRLVLEEEGVEARLTLNVITDMGLAVSRREDGMLVASVDDKTQATPEQEDPIT